ncbi:MAG: hypothetical protein HY321_22180 [Armatimonadetes bacterium]|nr:hypothetical protein [Armatimonadota bacterium]
MIFDSSYLVMGYSDVRDWIRYQGLTTGGAARAQYMPGIGEASGHPEYCDPLATSGYSRLCSDCKNGRHNVGINMTFCDGHVKWITMKTVINESLLLADANAGRPSIGGAWRLDNP